jgi:hypothetical protein
MSEEKEVPKIIIRNDEGDICPYFIADSPIVKRLSGLTQIMHDLLQAKELMTLIDQVDNDEIKYSLWLSSVVTYAKCFTSANNGRGIKLEEEHVNRFNPESLNYHKGLIELRHSYFAHAGDSESIRARIGIILSPIHKDKKVLWANHIMLKQRTITDENVKLFCFLCDGIYKVVEEISNKTHEKVLDEYRKMDVDLLYEKANNKTPFDKL